MNFLVEFQPNKNNTFNGLNNIIFEYLNFRPFIQELLDKTKLIVKHIESCYDINEIDGQYGYSRIVRRDKGWEMDCDHSYTRENLYYIFERRMKILKIKDNSNNFGYGNGLSMCYMYY